jgi:hypothetical protein
VKRTVAVIVLWFALWLIAFAQGKEKHVMRTVTNISENSVTVETTAKRSVTVEVTEKTKFERSGASATLKDLKVGEKVVVHADISDNKLIANEVQFDPKGKSMEGLKATEGMDHE